MTSITDFLIFIVACYYGWYTLSLFKSVFHLIWAISFFVLGFGALLGGVRHGFGPNFSKTQKKIIWFLTLIFVGISSQCLFLSLFTLINNNSINNLKLEKLPEIICEPGRAIVAESGSTIVRVNLRKKQKLYINDGTYGTLFDAGVPNIVYPSRIITSGRIISKKLTSFDFYGPTCDSMDYMKGPFILPNNIKEGDYIELGQLGAYGLTFRTQFNGYYSDSIYEVCDDPIMTMYDKETNKEFLVA